MCSLSKIWGGGITEPVSVLSETVYWGQVIQHVISQQYGGQGQNKLSSIPLAEIRFKGLLFWQISLRPGATYISRLLVTMGLDVAVLAARITLSQCLTQCCVYRVLLPQLSAWALYRRLATAREGKAGLGMLTPKDMLRSQLRGHLSSHWIVQIHSRTL